jgi:hypothetical protein
MTHDSPDRLTVKQWKEWADICKRDGLDHLILICLNNAACQAAESDRTVAEMLLSEGGVT